MKTKTLIGVIVWTIDPNNNKRYLIRHNKPFDGYPDEWNFVYGHIEKNESEIEAAQREVSEEFGLSLSKKDLNPIDYTISKSFETHITQIIYFSTKLDNINISICLNEESIGFDWVLENELSKKLIHKEQFRAIKYI